VKGVEKENRDKDLWRLFDYGVSDLERNGAFSKFIVKVSEGRGSVETWNCEKREFKGVALCKLLKRRSFLGTFFLKNAMDCFKNFWYFTTYIGSTN